MNNTIAPILRRLVDEHWVLWYAVSNNYSIVDQQFYTHLDAYLKAEDLNTFSNYLNYSKADASALAIQLDQYLHDCTRDVDSSVKLFDGPLNEQPLITETYQIKQLSVVVSYPSNAVKQIIHPTIAHYTASDLSGTTDVQYTIELRDEYLILFENNHFVTSCLKTDYHLLQGKFAMRLICALYKNKETDWVGTFHASTVSDGYTSILCIGESGRGKSTLTALLGTQGFDVLADDVTPLLSKDLHLYRNPKAVSIKQGAFGVLEDAGLSLEELPSYTYSRNKGQTKFVSFEAHHLQDHFPCRTIIMVNYKAGAKTQVEEIPTIDALKLLIPDSWLSPDYENAQRFLEWISSLRCYSLQYSDTEDVIAICKKRFEEDRIYFSQ